MKWRRFFLGAQTRILTSLLLLMTISIATSVVTIREILSALLNQRIERSLVQEVAEINRLVNDKTTTGDFHKDDVSEIFDIFLSRSVPDDNEYLIAIINGKLYKTSPMAIPAYLRQNPALIQYWAQLKQPQQGEKVTSTGTFLYLAQPIKTQGDETGVFVVANFATKERQEIDLAVFVVTVVIIIVFILALAIAWIVTGKVLAPLRVLTETAQSITDSEQNLNRRIPVQGAYEVAKLATTFNAMLDKLQASFASQNDFINDASHELRTPITIIQGHLDLLNDHPKERQETLVLVNDELNRMSRFVGDLLLLARAERPDFLTLDLVEVDKLITEIYAKAVALAVRNWRLESKTAVRIVADRYRLTQIMMNLIKNAIEHTTASDTIETGAKLARDKVHFWVRDTGAGIEYKDQVRIFQRFARASHGRRRSEGAGLGLSIVAAIAAAHGGWVELASESGKGSTFTAVIPLEPPYEVMN